MMASVNTESAENESLREALQELSRDQLVEAVLERDAQVRDLKLLLNKAIKPFPQKSERIGLEQLVLLLDKLPAEERARIEEEENQARAALARREAQGPAKPRRPPLRKPLPADLPREVQTVRPSAEECVCPGCGVEKTVISTDATEYLERRTSFVVKRVERQTLGCPNCKVEMVTAAAPARPLQGGQAGATVLADVAVRKFYLHEPLSRVRKAYLLDNVDISEAALGEWSAYVADELAPLVQHWEEQVMGCFYIQTDDTGVRVLDQDNERGVKKGHLWPYVGSNQAVFKYTPSKEAKGPREHLMRARCIYMQSDAAPAYNAIHARGILEVGCWMHARRYFYGAFEGGDQRAVLPLFLIAQLYEVEEDAAALGPEERTQLRRKRSIPILNKLDAWRGPMMTQAPPKTPLGRALTYLDNQWAALRRYTDDGRLRIDNGEVERLQRLVAVGRKNWLFFGSDEGARRGAVLYSVIATCVLNQVNPLHYIADVLQKLAVGWKHSALEELLPARWLQTRPHALLPPPNA